MRREVSAWRRVELRPPLVEDLRRRRAAVGSRTRARSLVGANGGGRGASPRARRARGRRPPRVRCTRRARRGTPRNSCGPSARASRARRSASRGSAPRRSADSAGRAGRSQPPHSRDTRARAPADSTAARDARRRGTRCSPAAALFTNIQKQAYSYSLITF